MFGDDDTILRSRKKGQQLSPIGVSYNPVSDGITTTTLIGACYAITNIHLYSKNAADIDLSRPPEFDFRIGQNDPTGFSRSTRAWPVAIGKLKATEGNREEDWMVLELQDCLGREFGWIEPKSVQSTDVVARVGKLTIAGYAADQSYFRNGIWFDPNCTVYQEDYNMWLHDCATKEATSGAPLLLSDAENKLTMAALHVGTRSMSISNEPIWSYETSNEAIPVSFIYEKIKKYIGK